MPHHAVVSLNSMTPDARLRGHDDFQNSFAEMRKSSSKTIFNLSRHSCAGGNPDPCRTMLLSLNPMALDARLSGRDEFQSSFAETRISKPTPSIFFIAKVYSMENYRRIYIAGHRGLVGSALLRRLAATHSNIITRSRVELDLTDASAVERFFVQEQPEYVFLAAAKVGGILANSTYPAEFYRENILIQTNIIDAAYRYKVKRLLFLGSSCIYPRDCPQPMLEKYLLSGRLEPSNRAYAIAKISGITMCQAYNQQYGCQFLSVMPTNLYGPNDQYDLQNSHVLPALLRKCHEAKLASLPNINAWGTGMVRREFLHSDDLADACVFLMNSPDEIFNQLLTHDPPIINIGSGHDLTIKDLAELTALIVGYSGEITWDLSKPDGTPQKLLDISRLSALGWQPTISLSQGIARTYQDFLATDFATPKPH